MNITDRLRSAFGYEKEDFVPDHPGDWDTNETYEFEDEPGFHPSPLPPENSVDILNEMEFRMKLHDHTYYVKGIEVSGEKGKYKDSEGEPQVLFIRVWINDEGEDIGGTYRIYNDVYDDDGNYGGVEIEVHNFGPDSLWDMAVRDSMVSPEIADGFVGWFEQRRE